MKKWLMVSVFCFSALLAACSGIDTNVLTVPELTDRERQILDTASNQSFVFDFTKDRQFTNVSVWLEKYENGKKAAEPISHLSAPLPKESSKGSILLTAAQTIDKQLLFSASIGDSEGTVSISNQDEMKELSNMAILTSSNSSESQELAENMILGSIIFIATEAGTPVSSLSQEFYEKQDGYLDELQKYDVVYLLKASFE